MEQITDEERAQIAALVAEGAPFWKINDEISRTVGGGSSDPTSEAAGPAGAETIPAALVARGA